MPANPPSTPVVLRPPDPATDPAPEPDTRGDWSWYAVMPVVFAVAALRWVRIRVGVALIDLGVTVTEAGERILPGVGR